MDSYSTFPKSTIIHSRFSYTQLPFNPENLAMALFIRDAQSAIWRRVRAAHRLITSNIGIWPAIWIVGVFYRTQ